MILEILGLKICFAILIPWPEKEQNPSSAGNQKSKKLQRAWPQGNWFIMSHDDFFISGFPILDGVSARVFVLTSWATFQQLPRGWARVPRQWHSLGGHGGQCGCREALPACRPREPGEEGWSQPQPRNHSRCFGEVRLGKGSTRPPWVLTAWHHQIAVEAPEGSRQTFILLPSIRVYEPGSGL